MTSRTKRSDEEKEQHCRLLGNVPNAESSTEGPIICGACNFVVLISKHRHTVSGLQGGREREGRREREHKKQRNRIASNNISLYYIS